MGSSGCFARALSGMLLVMVGLNAYGQDPPARTGSGGLSGKPWYERILAPGTTPAERKLASREAALEKAKERLAAAEDQLVEARSAESALNTELAKLQAERKALAPDSGVAQPQAETRAVAAVNAADAKLKTAEKRLEEEENAAAGKQKAVALAKEMVEQREAAVDDAEGALAQATKAEKKATEGAGAALADAEHNLADAQEDYEKAQSAARQAREEVQELTQQLKEADSAKGKERVARKLEKARERLTAADAQVSGEASAVKDAEKSVAEKRTAVKSTRQAAAEGVQAAQERVRSQQKALEAAQLQVKKAETALEAAAASVEAAEAEVADVKSLLKGALKSQKKAAREAARDETVRRCRQLDLEITQLQEKTEVARARVAVAGNGVTASRSAVADAEEAVKVARKQLAEAEREAAAAAAREEKERAEAEKLAQIERDIGKARKDVAEAKNALVKAKGQQADAQAELDALSSAGKATPSSDALQEQLATANTESDKAAAALAKAKQQLAEAQKELADRAAAVPGLKDAAKAAAAELADARTHARKQAKEPAATVTQREKEAAAADKKLQAVRGELAELKEDRQDVTAAVAETQKALASAETDRAKKKLTAKVAKAREKLEEATGRVRDCEAKATAAERERAAAQRAVEEAKNALNGATGASRKTVAAAESKDAAAAQNLADAESKLMAARERLEELEQTVDSTEDERVAAAKRVASIEGQLAPGSRFLKAQARAESELAEARAQAGAAATAAEQAATALKAAEEKLAGLVATAGDLRPAAPSTEPTVSASTEVGSGGSVVTSVEIRDKHGLLDSVLTDGWQIPFRERSLADELRDELEGQRADSARLGAICSKYQKKLVEAQFFLASVAPAVTSSEDLKSGRAVVIVTSPTVGECSFFEEVLPEPDRTWQFWRKKFYTQWGEPAPAGEPKRVPYEGTFFSEKQLRSRLARNVGEPFNYKTFFRDVYALNTIPDLTLSGNLRVKADPRTRVLQSVDTDFMVEEDIPLHLALSIDNSGTEVTDRWRGSARIQYLNLTKRFDVLSADFGSSPDGSYYWASGSYYCPLPTPWNSSLTLYASRTWVDINEIAQQTDAESDGRTYGLQLRSTLIPMRKREIALNLGVSHRTTENMTAVGVVQSEVKTTYTPGIVGLEYFDKEADILGGRTFLAGSVLFSREWWLDSDDNAEFNRARVGASPDFTVYKYKGARVQKLGWGEGPKWLLYAKVEGQYTRNPLVPTEQLAIGGMNSVRGYEEREALGDIGVNASVELRTPLLSHRSLDPRKVWLAVTDRWFDEVKEDQGELRREISTAKKDPFDTIQFLAFFDAGSVYRHEPQPGEYRKADMLSVGAGMRVSFWNRLQLRVDYGYPLEDTSDDGIERTEASENGRVHVKLETQF